MLVPLLALAGAAALAWLSVFDRTTPLALSLVELESKVGFKLWPVFALVGGVLLLARIFQSVRHRPTSPARPLTRDAGRTFGATNPRPSTVPAVVPTVGPPVAPAVDPPVEGDGNAIPAWLAAVRAQARGVTDDAMGRIRFDEAPNVPLTLVLTAVTPEQARRRIAAYANWLATIPTPPCARVRLVSSPDIEGPLHGVFRGELVRHFPGDAFAVVSLHQGTDALFNTPDGRWLV